MRIARGRHSIALLAVLNLAQLRCSFSPIISARGKSVEFHPSNDKGFPILGMLPPYPFIKERYYCLWLKKIFSKKSFSAINISISLLLFLGGKRERQKAMLIRN